MLISYKTVYICTTILGNGKTGTKVGVHNRIEGIRKQGIWIKENGKKFLEKRKNGLPLPNFRRKRLVWSKG